ncbi:MAG TPA: hypothetical protein VJ508_18775, partial [Saprospiraceae bacterium]|nr:hypothetical protein [Saprospiraceae bacterium]
SQTWFTFTLPGSSLPSSVATTGTNPVHVWIAEYGLNRIGQVIYTDTSHVTFIEYPVTSTANSQPFRLTLNGNYVWFTERGANRIGRLDATTGQVVEFYGHGLSAEAGLAGIDIAPDGSLYLAEQTINRLARLVVTSTYAFHEYTTGVPIGPFGIAVEDNSRVHFTAPGSNQAGFLTPSTGGIVLATYIPPGSSPYDIAWDSAHEIAWFSEPNYDHLGGFFMGTLGIPTQLGPIARPYGLSHFKGNQLWITQQVSAGALARFVYTSTLTGEYSFTSYALPVQSLLPTSVSVAADNSVWTAAYVTVRIYLPVIFKNH